MAIQPPTVETRLGVNGRRGGCLGLADSIIDGLAVTALDRLAGAVAPDDARFKFLLVPKATLDHRKKSTQQLTSEEDDKLARLAQGRVLYHKNYYD